MIVQEISRPHGFRVIEGGRSTKARTPAKAKTAAALAMPYIPEPDAMMLASEMGSLYALALLRDVPFRDMNDPNCAVWIDGATRITLHELLTELNALPRHHPQYCPAGDAPVAALSSLSVPGNADHRCRSRSDGQWCIADLLNGGLCRSTGARRASVFLEAEILGTVPPEPDIAPALPGERAPMSHWLAWAETATGACLPLPGRGNRAAPVRTPRDLATQTHLRDPRHEGLAVAMLLLAQGMPFDVGLPDRGPLGGQGVWTGPRLLTLMAEAARRAARTARRQERRSDRLARPAVVAARLALMHECEEMRTGPDFERLSEVLNLLRERTPRLLDWVARLNAACGTGGFALPNRDGSKTHGWTPLRFRQNLMLPALHHDGAALRSADVSDRAVIAGALITLLKAVFADANTDADDAANRADLTPDLDALAANLALGRSVAGGFYPYENKQNLLFGQGIALQILRETLEADGQRANLSLRDFGGRSLHLRATRARPGLARATLFADGVAQLWPECGADPAQHLTAVV